MNLMKKNSENVAWKIENTFFRQELVNEKS